MRMWSLSGLFLSSMAASLRLSSARPPRSVVRVAMLCEAPARGEFHPFSSAVHLQIEGLLLQV